jgi:Uma2 family endonuclease
MLAQRRPHFSVADYLQQDQQHTEKLEYYEGEIVVQAGSSARHNLIVSNLIGHGYAALRSRGCQIFPSDMRVRAIDQRVYTYPDVSIVCGTPQYAEPTEVTLLNPTVIIEILSPSTQGYDQRSKLMYYRAIDSLQAYLLIAQDRPHVQYYSRQKGALWSLQFADNLTSTITIRAISLTLALTEIYSGIAFPDGGDL